MVMSLDQTQFIILLKPEDGTIRWAYETGGDIRNSPSITSNGGVYFGSTDNTLYHLNTDGELESCCPRRAGSTLFSSHRCFRSSDGWNAK